MRVHGVAQPAGREVLVDIAMGDLSERMHAGIGPARAVHTHVSAAGRLDRCLQRALHGRMIGLELPARERSAVIFDGELVARHLYSMNVMVRLVRNLRTGADDPVLCDVSFYLIGCGVLDTPLSRGMTASQESR